MLVSDYNLGLKNRNFSSIKKREIEIAQKKGANWRPKFYKCDVFKSYITESNLV